MAKYGIKAKNCTVSLSEQLSLDGINLFIVTFKLPDSYHINIKSYNEFER